MLGKCSHNNPDQRNSEVYFQKLVLIVNDLKIVFWAVSPGRNKITMDGSVSRRCEPQNLQKQLQTWNLPSPA